MTAETRAARARAVAEQIGAEYGTPHDPANLPELLDAAAEWARVVVVEISTRDRRPWYTPCAGLEDAAESVDGQEYPEDWRTLYAVDLDTGARHVPRVRTSWELADGVALVTIPGETAEPPNAVGIVR